MSEFKLKNILLPLTTAFLLGVAISASAAGTTESRTCTDKIRKAAVALGAAIDWSFVRLAKRPLGTQLDIVACYHTPTNLVDIWTQYSLSDMPNWLNQNADYIDQEFELYGRKASSAAASISASHKCDSTDVAAGDLYKFIGISQSERERQMRPAECAECDWTDRSGTVIIEGGYADRINKLQNFSSAFKFAYADTAPQETPCGRAALDAQAIAQAISDANSSCSDLFKREDGLAEAVDGIDCQDYVDSLADAHNP